MGDRMTSSRLPASLSLDLDNKWSYLKTHGDESWRSFPSYLPYLVPRVLSFLQERKLRLTFFVVGQDADRPESLDVLRLLGAAGHEIGNHSYHHEPWFHLYDLARTTDELTRAHDAIERATGSRPRGFRGPGFSLSHSVLSHLADAGYLYDASTLPTYLGPLARAYYMWGARLDDAERERRSRLFGSFAEGQRPIRPYYWLVGDRRLLELPVTTMPGLRVPFHLSYVLYLAGVSSGLALAYFRAALRVCELRRVPVSLLLHPLDFLGVEDERDLGFFPAMRLSRERKLRVVSRALEILSRRYELMPMGAFADAVRREPLRDVGAESLPGLAEPGASPQS
jgi:hypothetical protein